MSRPIHTVKYMKAVYRKYQILAVACTLLTITTALLTSLVNLRASGLLKEREAQLANTPPKVEYVADPKVAEELVQLRKELTNTKQKMAELQIGNQNLKVRADWLSRQLSKATGQSATQPEQEMQLSPDGDSPSVPELQNNVETAPETPSGTQDASQSSASDPGTSVAPELTDAPEAPSDMQDPAQPSAADLGTSLIPPSTDASKPRSDTQDVQQSNDIEPDSSVPPQLTDEQ
ncbi:MAG: hypothetical protein HKP58_08465 [Desulfatitalea sp.]|nr:hypothetical protein [Desulfatitalea sp.]NNK00434.1 hypothetical protein [Desulfatitalea sp.]